MKRFLYSEGERLFSQLNIIKSTICNYRSYIISHCLSDLILLNCYAFLIR